MKLLVIGFQNSGTTMLRRLLCCHPDIRWIFHETFYLNDTSTKEHIRAKIRTKHGFNIDKHIWGEKIPFIYPRMVKSNVGSKCSIIDYARQWKIYFAPDYKIIHIVRHPVDVIMGNKTRKSIKEARTLKWYEDTVFLAIKKFEESILVKYEDILLNFNVTMKSLLEAVGISSDRGTIELVENAFCEKFKKLNQSRAFGYSGNKRHDILDKKYQNLRKIIKEINAFAGGINKYNS